MKKNTRFALFFDEKAKEAMICIIWGFINEFIFKDKKDGKWKIGLGLNGHDFKDTPEGNHSWKVGMPHMAYIAPFKEWRMRETIELRTPFGQYILGKDDIQQIRTLICERDKRINFNKAV